MIRREFIKQLGFGTAAVGLMTLPTFVNAYPAVALARSLPEDQGVSSQGLLAFLDAIEKSKIEFHSLMVLRHGKVIAEGWWSPYLPEYKHTLYSLSKSFTSTAVGLAITEGKFKLDTKVVSFFPDELPAEVSPNLAAMTVKDLLTMSTGHDKDTINPMRLNTTGDSWAKIFLSIPVDHQPGTHFVYNTGATYMQSAIVQKAVGMNVLEYLKPRLFEPLGIEGMDWELDPKGIAVGGYGLRVRTEDIAKFGQLYLQKGKWNGKQLLPADWIAQATSAQVPNAPTNPTRPNEENDWAQGYGFQFWRCTHNAVRGDGAFGQFCMMIPEHDMVVAITSESFDLQASMKLVWDYLLPAVKDVAKDKAGQDALKKKLTSLSLPVLSVRPTSDTAFLSRGKKYLFADNPMKLKSISFKFVNDSVITIQDDTTEYTINCGRSRFVTNSGFKTNQIFPIVGRGGVTSNLAASGTWTTEKSFALTLRYVETAHGDNITFDFEGDNVTVKFQNSVAKGNPNSPDPRAAITGKLSA